VEGRRRRAARNAIGLFDRHHTRTDAFPSLTDPTVTCRYVAAMVLQAQGYADQARRRSQETLALAEARAASPFTHGKLLGILTLFHLARREGARAQAVMGGTAGRFYATDLNGLWLLASADTASEV
jgi:hypothetical protein